MKCLFATIVLTACAIVLTPLSARSDDDWEDRYEDWKERQEEAREDYEDWLEDQREDAEDWRERQEDLWKRQRRYAPPSPVYSYPYGQNYQAPYPGVQQSYSVQQGYPTYPPAYTYRSYAPPPVYAPRTFTFRVYRR